MTLLYVRIPLPSKTGRILCSSRFLGFKGGSDWGCDYPKRKQMLKVAHFGMFDVENFGDLSAPGSVRCSARDSADTRVRLVVDWPTMLFEPKTNYSIGRRGGP